MQCLLSDRTNLFFRCASLGFGLVVALLVATQVHAQVSPQINPGIIQKQIQQQRQRIEQQTPKQKGPVVVGPKRAPAVKVPGGGPTFVLRKVVFDKSKFITPKELHAIAAKFVGKRVTIADLQKLVADVNALYAQRGIVTAIATLPPQTVSKGIVHVKLTEGRLEKTSITGAKHLSKNYIKQRINPPKGKVLDVPKLKRDLVWFNRTNDAQLRALLRPGTSFGLTDLQLAVTEPPRNVLQLFYDNQGVETTGQNEGGMYYKLNDLLGIDDRLVLYGVKSEGNINGDVAYNFPIDPWGGRIGASYTQGAIKIVQGDYTDLDVTGRTNEVSVNFGQPLWATDMWLLQANAAYAYGNSETDFSSVAVTMDRYSKATGGFALTMSNADYSLSVAPAANQIDWHDKILGDELNFTTFTGSVNAFVKLPAQFNATAQASWQYTSEKQVPGDQLFSIGGPTTVRGYPTNVVAGNSGYFFNLELHRDMSDILKGVDVYAFLDSGSVYSTFPPTTQLDSSGGGISWSPVSALTLEASVGFPWRTVVADQPHDEFYGRVIFRPLSLF